MELIRGLTLAIIIFFLYASFIFRAYVIMYELMEGGRQAGRQGSMHASVQENIHSHLCPNDYINLLCCWTFGMHLQQQQQLMAPIAVVAVIIVTIDDITKADWHTSVLYVRSKDFKSMLSVHRHTGTGKYVKLYTHASKCTALDFQLYTHTHTSKVNKQLCISYIFVFRFLFMFLSLSVIWYRQS